MAIQEEMPSAEELFEKDGGFYFSRPSDGHNLEYFDSNASGSTIILAIHGSSSTGRYFTYHEDFAKENSLRIISPSLPGFGASDSYENMHIPSVLNTFSSDVLALLDHLQVEKFYIIGVSMGCEFSFMIGSHATKNNRLLGFSSAVGLVLPQETFGRIEEKPFHLRMIGRVLSNRYISWPLFHGLLRPFMGERMRPMMPEGISEDRASFLVQEVARSHQYTFKGSLYAISEWTLQAQGHETYTNYSVFAENIPVQLYYGTRDTLVDFTNQRFIMDRIKHATAISFEGDHAEVDCEFALSNLLNLNK